MFMGGSGRPTSHDEFRRQLLRLSTESLNAINLAQFTPFQRQIIISVRVLRRGTDPNVFPFNIQAPLPPAPTRIATPSPDTQIRTQRSSSGAASARRVSGIGNVAVHASTREVNRRNATSRPQGQSTSVQSAAPSTSTSTPTSTVRRVQNPHPLYQPRRGRPGVLSIFNPNPRPITIQEVDPASLLQGLSLNDEPQKIHTYPEYHQDVLTEVSNVEYVSHKTCNDKTKYRKIGEAERHILGKFQCPQCKKKWPSGKVFVLIHRYKPLSRQRQRGLAGGAGSDANRQQKVLVYYNVEIYNQDCKKCDKLAFMTLDKSSYVSKISRRLRRWQGEEFPESQSIEKRTKPHEQGFCEGCKIGRCERGSAGAIEND